MAAYPEAYVPEVVETQGKLFDLVSDLFPDADTEGFIRAYMRSKTRASIDAAQAYVCTMDAPTLLDYFLQTDCYTPVAGKTLGGFLPDWIGEFYAYYQWYYDLSSAELVDKVPVSFLVKAYAGLHDLDLDIAVAKVGEVR